MNPIATIPVFDLFGPSIHTRESSMLLIKEVENVPYDFVAIDFSKIEYISRSFADQFYFDKMKLLSSKKKNINIINANEIVVKMLNAVSKTQHKAKRSFFNIPVYKYTSKDKLDDFLLSI